MSAGESPGGGRGQMLLDLISCVERSMDEVHHVLPAVDHLASVPAAPGPGDAVRVGHTLATSASPGLCAAFERWRACHEAFEEGASRLRAMHDSADGVVAPADLHGEIESFRATRAKLFEAADDLRVVIAKEIDA